MNRYFVFRVNISENMKRYIVSRFDEDTFVIIDQNEQKEICVCSNYDGWEDAEERASNIVMLLNAQNHPTK